MTSSFATFATNHARLVSSMQLLNAQLSQQKELSSHMTRISKDIVSEMRLLSLVRSKLIHAKSLTADKLIESQALKGLRISSLEYCPGALTSNMVNQYGFFVEFLRRNPDVFAELLFSFAVNNPKKLGRLAYSCLLTVCQQGWCREEDITIVKTLNHIIDIQFGSNRATSVQSSGVFIQPYQPRKLKLPCTSVDVAVNLFQPSIEFTTAYLFNGASMAYLQSSLAPIIVKIQSLSSLYNVRSEFDTVLKNEEEYTLGLLEYWTEIVKFAKMVLSSLITCMDLLPPGVFELFKHLRSKDIDTYFFFFESFINRALDNPAVLGLLPWNPSHADWNPSHDIADVFRTSRPHNLASKSFLSLSRFLVIVPEFKDINVDVVLQALVERDGTHSPFMISEADLLATSPSFPKELLVTVKDLFLLHSACYGDHRVVSEKMSNIIKSLGEKPDLTKKMKDEHFRIVITRPAKKGTVISRAPSLFDGLADAANAKSQSDAYMERFCDVIAVMPASTAVGSSVGEVIERYQQISHLFVNAKSWAQAEAVLWYARKIIASEEELIGRMTGVIESRETRTLEATDRTASLKAQFEHMSSALDVARSIRENLQSHMSLRIAESFVRETMGEAFKDAFSIGHNFVTNVELFQKTTDAFMTKARSLVASRIPAENVSQICRVIFYKLTSHVTFTRYMNVRKNVDRGMAIKGDTSTEEVWKRSVIISKIIDTYRDRIIQELESDQPDTFVTKKQYLERASDLLGHIRGNSGISVILYYVLSCINVVQTTCNNCRELNFDGCLLWVLVTTRARHIFGISHFLQHFVLNRRSFLDTILDKDEISLLGVFPSAIMILLKLCNKYDKRVVTQWAFVTSDEF